MAAKMAQTIKARDLRSVTVLCGENKVFGLVDRLLRIDSDDLLKGSIVHENKTLEVVKTKMALASTIYDIPVDLPLL